jgi:hypothetical protein
LIRIKCGLAPRGGNEQQPWYLYSKGVVDTEPRGPVQMRYAFHVTDLPSTCSLVVERPEDYRITVNDRPAEEVEGYWVDEDLKKIDISGQLQTGENSICLDFDYRPDMELEDLYLSGDFGVTKRDPREPPSPGNVTLIAPVRQLGLGSWVGQGLDFYGAAVRYRLTVTRPPGNQRLHIRLPGICCTAAAIHVGDRTFVLPWAPFEADVTEALENGTNDVGIEVIGGRKNILGPLHVPWEPRTGAETFSPDHPKWSRNYLLNDHGLMKPVLIETVEQE